MPHHPAVSASGTSLAEPASGEAGSKSRSPKSDALPGEKPCSLPNVSILEPSTPTLQDNNSSKAGPGNNNGRRNGFSYASGFNPVPDAVNLPSTPTKIQDTNAAKPDSASHVVTPSSCSGGSITSSSCATSSPMSASVIKRQLDMTEVAPSSPSKKKAKAPKPTLSDLDVGSILGIKSLYLIVKGAYYEIPSSPVETFEAICHEYNVRELSVLMKATLNQDWPKNQKKTPAINMFAKMYIQHISGDTPSSVNDTLPTPVAPPPNDFSMYACAMFRFVFTTSVLTRSS